MPIVTAAAAAVAAAAVAARGLLGGCSGAARQARWQGLWGLLACTSRWEVWVVYGSGSTSNRPHFALIAVGEHVEECER